MRARRVVQGVACVLMVLALCAGLTVQQSAAGLIGHGWANMRSIDPEVYYGAWGYYSFPRSTWISSYYDTRFIYFSTKYYDLFAPIYTKTAAAAPWVPYATGWNQLRWQAYWLAFKPQGDDAMLDAVTKVNNSYQGRVRVFLAYGSDVGTSAWGLFSWSTTPDRVINACSITLNSEDLKSVWNPAAYNVNFVSWIGATLCHETCHQQWALTTRYVRILGLDQQLDAYEMAFDEGLAHYGGAMAYRWVRQAIASGVEGYFATSYDDLRTKMINSEGDWYNLPSVGYRYYPGRSATDKDRWQLVALGCYLVHWHLPGASQGTDDAGEGQAVYRFLTRTAAEIDKRGTSFKWINPVQWTFRFSSMSDMESPGPTSYRSWWGIRAYTFKVIIPPE